MKFKLICGLLLVTSSAMANVEVAEKIRLIQLEVNNLSHAEKYKNSNLIYCNRTQGTRKTPFLQAVNSLLAEYGILGSDLNSRVIYKFIQTPMHVTAVEIETGFIHQVVRCPSVQELSSFIHKFDR